MYIICKMFISCCTFQTYANSKLANILFTKSIASKWSEDGIRSYSVHPGFVRTNIFNKGSKFSQQIYPFATYLFGKNCEQGAQTSIYCCLEDDLVNGGFYADCRQVIELALNYFHFITELYIDRVRLNTSP